MQVSALRWSCGAWMPLLILCDASRWRCGGVGVRSRRRRRGRREGRMWHTSEDPQRCQSNPAQSHTSPDRIQHRACALCLSSDLPEVVDICGFYSLSNILLFFSPRKKISDPRVPLVSVYSHVMSRKKNILLLMNKIIKATRKIQKKKAF